MIDSMSINNVLWQFTIEAYKTTVGRHTEPMDAYDEAIDIATAMTERFIETTNRLQKENGDGSTKKGGEVVAGSTGDDPGVSGQGKASGQD